MFMHRPCVITLLTDFGNQDAYAGVMKGVITGINPQANIIDICHNVPPQDVFNAAYLIYTSYKYFPKGTIHIAVVDPGVGSERDIVCVKTNDYTFLAPDNGILGFIIEEEKPKVIVRLTNDKYFLPSISNTFHGRDVFAPVAAHLSLGVKPQQLGVKINQLKQLDIPKPSFKETGQLEGEIIYIDRFGNLITNITKKHLMQFINKKSEARSRKFKTSAQQKYSTCDTMEITVWEKKITRLGRTYMDVKRGEPLALIGSAGFLEISINQGNAQKYFKVKIGNKIHVG